MSTAAPEPTRVLLVDDHAVFRYGLRLVIESRPHLQVVAEARTSEEALHFAATNQPDIMLLDVDLNGEDGIDLIPALREVAPRSQIILMTGNRNVETHRRAVLMGAKGVVVKDGSIAQIFEAIERVTSGEVWLEPGLVADVLRELTRPPSDAITPSRIMSLTAREREVVDLVCKGLKNQLIAERLAISEATVRHHLTSVFSKLGINDRVELVIFAYENGLVSSSRG